MNKPQGIRDAIANASRSQSGQFKARAFTPAKLDYALTESLMTEFIGAKEAPPTWLGRVSDDPSACIAINDIAAWSLSLADAVRPLLASIVATERTDLIGGTDIYSFIANAGWTPFGIHKDNEPSMIFHLGPAPKDVLGLAARRSPSK